ncbi:MULTISPECIES: NAD(P)/FAD-dependent oxidoreductase [Rhodococcus]|uniref:NAD(P)/FAD-dependent oxidoreductase n=1 Tax=Rhodococcus TaxID=1827 RepID=UPI0007181F7D|nr:MULTISPECIES: FAD-dependent oxidoreductase [Rhodococcus]MCZ4618570.1 FAD-dependent oxidoreductase [Rhodococcus qingshengii]MEA1798461.1 FAD-dependent oxidoreductase [Rhodococcus qingshengii]ORI27886.1 hypothetical protein BH686_02015 [Rhodococcus erythropolis]
MRVIVIIGTGVAGSSAANTLRAEGFDGRIVMIGEEAYAPYRRPTLSKDLLAGTTAIEKALLHPAGHWAANDIELRLSTQVTTLNTATRILSLDTGETISYDTLLLATGGRPRIVAHRAGIRMHQLRGVADVESLRTAILDAGSLLVIGAGLIGMEVAATARELGAAVTILEAGVRPLSRFCPREAADYLVGLHRAHGVDIQADVQLAAIEESEDSVIATDASGRTWSAAMALSAVGMLPNTDMAAAAGIDVDNGITIDEQHRTSAPAVFAAGDVANIFDPVAGRRTRHENWNSALAQGDRAARSILGRPLQPVEVPWGWTSQYGKSLQFAGVQTQDSEHVVLGSVPDGDFTILMCRNGSLVGATAMKRPKDIRIARTLIREGSSLNRDVLGESPSLSDYIADRQRLETASPG